MVVAAMAVVRGAVARVVATEEASGAVTEVVAKVGERVVEVMAVEGTVAVAKVEEMEEALEVARVVVEKEETTAATAE